MTDAEYQALRDLLAEMDEGKSVPELISAMDATAGGMPIKDLLAAVDWPR